MTAEKAMRPAFSVAILTLNEERNIRDCLDSVQGCGDLFVVDSGSTDRTVQIAEYMGARVLHNAFRSFGQQRNWAHASLPPGPDWILHLDADERATPALLAEIRSAVAADDGSLAGYYIAERTLLRGRWLRHASQYPRYQARLVHRGRMRFIDHGHGQREHSELGFGTLRQPYDHHAFSHGTEAWLRKHVAYAAREAAQVLAEAGQGVRLRDLLSADRTVARRAAKALSMKLPMRPFLRWVYVLGAKRGLLDGAAGLEYARMIKVFQQMIDLLLDEREGRHAGAMEDGIAAPESQSKSEARP